jgi:peroxiredoxin
VIGGARPARSLSRYCLATFFIACAPITPADEPIAPPASEATSSKPRAPGFELRTLRGDTLTLAQHLGKSAILIDFWATYCEPCLVALPEIETLYQRYRDRGLLVLGISVDGPESIALVRVEVAKLGLTFPILLDHDTRVLSLYNARGTAPYRVLIDKQGSVMESREGYAPGEIEQLEAKVRTALGR